MNVCRCGRCWGRSGSLCVWNRNANSCTITQQEVCAGRAFVLPCVRAEGIMGNQITLQVWPGNAVLWNKVVVALAFFPTSGNDEFSSTVWICKKKNSWNPPNMFSSPEGQWFNSGNKQIQEVIVLMSADCNCGARTATCWLLLVTAHH